MRAFKSLSPRADRLCMQRVFGLLLILAAIYLGVTIYTKDAERAQPALAGSENAENERAAPEPESARAPGTASPSAITSRVRDRVQGLVDERSDRIDGN